MVDIHSKDKRSEIMRKIGPKDSLPELFVRKLVHSLGYRYRLHRKDLPCSPDLVFPKYKKVIFVHGCFWHGHRGCKKAGLPKSNYAYWPEKIVKNRARDERNLRDLKELGWEPLVIWQCEIKQKDRDKLVNKVRKFLSC